MPGMTTFCAPANKSAVFTLPDSSRVLLGPSASLRCPAMFSGSTRQVTLTGEAWFDVHANQQHPFIVQLPSRNTSIELPATPLHISANAADTMIKLSLRDDPPLMLHH